MHHICNICDLICMYTFIFILLLLPHSGVVGSYLLNYLQTHPNLSLSFSSRPCFIKQICPSDKNTFQFLSINLKITCIVKIYFFLLKRKMYLFCLSSNRQWERHLLEFLKCSWKTPPWKSLISCHDFQMSLWNSNKWKTCL